MKEIAVLGSTGSVGTQALEVLKGCSDVFSVHTLAAGSNMELFAAQVRSIRPAVACFADTRREEELRGRLQDLPTDLRFGEEALSELLGNHRWDTVLAAISGFAGVRHVWAAVQSGNRIALANKEALVTAGQLLRAECARTGARIVPVDSEHSAVWQCLETSARRPEKLVLTGSGGPFRDTPASELPGVTPEMALCHPTWKMGPKITIDSATLANKGLEVIEANRLFGVPLRDIEVLIHRQSIVHSLVQFEDGAVLAQLGLPDMRLPILYALAAPESLPSAFPRLDLCRDGPLTFEAPRREDFPALGLAWEAGQQGDAGGLCYSTGNEVGVELFLTGTIRFSMIPVLIREAMDRFSGLPAETIGDILDGDRTIRRELRERFAGGMP